MRTAWLPLFLCAAGCISVAPPAPAVRWFDPVSGLRRDPLPIAFRSAPHLGRDFLVRTGPHELVVDGLHRWVADPHDLLALAAGSADPALQGVAQPAATAQLLRFELDVTAAPCACVALELRRGGALVPIEFRAPAAGREPAAAAAAMSAAIAGALDACAAALAR